MYIREAHPGDEWTDKGERLGMKHHKNIQERVSAAENLVKHLNVKGDVCIDMMDDSFSKCFNSWPARCFVIQDGRVRYIGGLLGFKGEDKALRHWLEINVLQLRTVTAAAKSECCERMKTVVVGDNQCGKTCLYNRFGKQKFPTEYIPSVFEHYVAVLQVDGKDIEIALWDTRDGEEYDRLRPLSYPNTDIILLMFSFGSSDSLLNCSSKWAPELNKFCKGVPVILVGGKKVQL